MSIYIKGCDVPKCCSECIFQSTDKTGELTFCLITKRVTRWWMNDRNESSEGHCPLISVPEHGELIDRDELKKKEWVIEGIGHYYNVEDVQNAPVIIPSDKKDSATYNIDWHYIDDDGYIRTKTLEKFDNLDSAMTVYRKYIRSGAQGWYDLIQCDRTAAKEKTE